MKINRLTYLIFLYLLIWGISELVPDLIFGDATSPTALMFTVFVPVEEQNSIYLLNLHYSTLFEFLIPVCFIPAILWYIYLYFDKYNKNKQNQNSDETLEKNIGLNKPKHYNLVKFLFMSSILALVVGLGIHYTGDAIDTQLQWSPEDLDGSLTTFPKLIAYFFDEVLGHKVLYGGMMLVLTSLLVFQYWSPINNEKKPSNIDIIILAFFGTIYGIAMGISYMEGQSAFEYLFVCLIQGIIVLVVFNRLKSKISDKIKKYPYFVFFIIFNISVVITLLAFIPQISNVYPFFPQ